MYFYFPCTCFLQPADSFKLTRVCLIEVVGAGQIERPPVIRRSGSLEDQTLQPHPLITDYIKQSQHHLTCARGPDMAWHALSLLINQLQAFMRSGMQMCVIAEGPISQLFCFNPSGLGCKSPVTNRMFNMSLIKINCKEECLSV